MSLQKIAYEICCVLQANLVYLDAEPMPLKCLLWLQRFLIQRELVISHRTTCSLLYIYTSVDVKLLIAHTHGLIQLVHHITDHEYVCRQDATLRQQQLRRGEAAPTQEESHELLCRFIANGRGADWAGNLLRSIFRAVMLSTNLANTMPGMLSNTQLLNIARAICFFAKVEDPDNARFKYAWTIQDVVEAVEAIMDGWHPTVQPPKPHVAPAVRARHQGQLTTNLSKGGKVRLNNIEFVKEGGVNEQEGTARQRGSPGMQQVSSNMPSAND